LNKIILAALLIIPFHSYSSEFSIKKYNLSIQLKEGWVGDKKAPKSVLALFKAQDSIERESVFIPNFSIVVDKSDGEKVQDSCEYATKLSPSLTKAGYQQVVMEKETISELNACSNTYVNVLKGQKKDSSVASDGEEETVSLKFRQYYIFHKKLIYIFTLTAKESEFEVRVLDALQMLLTLRLT
jgi:hypothetical protein